MAGRGTVMADYFWPLKNECLCENVPKIFLILKTMFLFRSEFAVYRDLGGAEHSTELVVVADSGSSGN